MPKSSLPHEVLRAICFVFFVLSLVAVSSAQAKEAPSFDCAKARHADESLICGEDLLAHADRSIAGFYRLLLDSVTPQAAALIKDAQHRWLQERNKVCGIHSDTALDEKNRGPYLRCFLRFYGQRGTELLLSASSTGISESNFKKLEALATSGDADAQAVLGAVMGNFKVGLSPGVRFGNPRQKNQSQSAAWLKSASNSGQVLGDLGSFQQIAGLQTPDGTEICRRGTEGLEQDEIRRILSLIHLEDAPQLLAFNCHEASLKDYFIVGTDIGSGHGSVYSVRLNTKNGSAREIVRGNFNVYGVIFGLNSIPFLIISRSGLENAHSWQGYDLINFMSGELLPIADGFGTDALPGGCDPEDVGLNAKEIGDLHLELRPDGLNDIVFEEKSFFCAPQKTEVTSRRFVPTAKGFSLKE